MRKFDYILCVLFIICSSVQVMGGGFKNAKINLFKLEPLEQPTFKPSKHPVGSSTGKWCKIELEYSLDGPKHTYVDKVEIRWYVVVSTDNSTSGWVAMTKKVRYDNIETSRKHHAAVFLAPWFFDRYVVSHRTEVSRVSVYAEIYIGGELVCVKDKKHSGVKGLRWWETMKELKWQESGLLSRSETPFCNVDLHYYDTETPETGNRK